VLSINPDELYKKLKIVRLAVDHYALAKLKRRGTEVVTGVGFHKTELLEYR
jgi:hypothetical protein